MWFGDKDGWCINTDSWGPMRTTGHLWAAVLSMTKHWARIKEESNFTFLVYIETIPNEGCV